ncbi:MAG TPA: hypothetical protein VMW10_12445 [Alphaproteobacteria bacterium]|nr:hypothetical protein [Alphaproteobacteria bacterium]
MWKNDYNQTPCSSLLRNKPYRDWNTSLDWPLASPRINKCSKGYFEHEQILLNKSSFTETTLLNCTTEAEAEAGIAQIQDPLWRRVCLDVLRTLGPVAFKNLWKTNLMSVSPRERRACITCPTKDIAKTVENYHFVIMGALKKFYPFLFSIETEISDTTRIDKTLPKASVSPYRHLT